MNGEEEKKAIEGLKDYVARIKKFHFEQTQGFKWVDITLNLLENQQKELNNLIEIEKSHKEENGKLRVELEQEKEKNKAFHDFIMFTGVKDTKDITATEYIKIKQEGYLEGRQEEHQKAEEIIMNNYISKDKIKEIVDELEEQIAEFKEYVKDSEGLEKIYWKRNLAELVGARNSLKGLLEEKNV